ncbi:MAG TPA: hypothetical protein VK932_01775 [Kofleriaceae bacterium]|nr:hypothetical protein [Kofleriaceae bacterium]
MRPCLRIALVAALAMAAGCPNERPPVPPVDSGGGNGLVITWESRPRVIPSEPSSDATIERVAFHQDDLRLVGDAGTIELARDELEWARGITPTALPVAGAVPGLYSRLLFELDGDDDVGREEYAYEITGTVKVNASFEPFTIRDTGDLTMTLDFSVMLAVGGDATIPVRVEIDKIVDVVDFSQVGKQDGRYLVENGSPQLSAVRTAVRAAFGVSDHQ